MWLNEEDLDNDNTDDILDKFNDLTYLKDSFSVWNVVNWGSYGNTKTKNILNKDILLVLKNAYFPILMDLRWGRSNHLITI